MYKSIASLNDRILNRKQFVRAQFPVQNIARPSSYKEWSDHQMSRAILAVQKGMSIRNAAASYNIPKSTLGDRMSERVVPGSTSGPPAYLTSEEEEQLVKFLTGCASVGYARSKKEVMALVSRVIEGKGKHVEISNGWWESFKKRNPKLILRLASPLSYARAIASDRDTLDCYYNLLEKTLLENGLSENPCNIFNCDETGMPLDSTGLRIVVEIGVKNPVHINSGCKSQITVLACVSASGYSLPPFVIFNRKSLNPQLVKGGNQERHMDSPVMVGLTKNFFATGLSIIFSDMLQRQDHFCL